MMLSFEQIKEEFRKDLNLARNFLITEAIDKSTKKTIQILGLQLVQVFKTTEAAKRGKLKILLARAVEAYKSYMASLNIPAGGNLNDYKQYASGTVAAIEFYFLMEDLFLALQQEIIKLKENQELFLKTKEETGQETNLNNLSIDTFLAPNDLVKFKTSILKVLNEKNVSTKDIQTIKFKKVTSDIPSKPILQQEQKQRIANDFCKMTFEELMSLLNLTKPILNSIKIVRSSIGSGLPEEIRDKILGVKNYANKS